jgi:hypothetical protein
MAVAYRIGVHALDRIATCGEPRLVAGEPGDGDPSAREGPMTVGERAPATPSPGHLPA